MAGRDAVRELLKEFLQTEEKLYQMETWYIRNEERATKMMDGNTILLLLSSLKWV